MNKLFIPDNPGGSEAPLLPNGEPKKSFEVRMGRAKGGGIEKTVYIGGELLDWAIDANSLMEAMKMGPKFFKEIQKDIERHYVDSVSEFLGRKVSAQDIKDAISTGWI
jgi:hypothetical protein